MSHWRVRTAVATALVVGCLGTAPAGAQGAAGQKAAAEALFDQALEALKAGRLDEACSRFEQSQEIDPAVGTLLYLAECYERTGRLASAWATFREASSAAAASGQEERAKVGAERAETLRPKLSYVTYNVGGNTALEGFAVQLDGKQIPAAVFGAPVPIDPGTHTLVASAPGHQTWQLQLQVPKLPGNQAVTVPTLEAQAQETKAPAAVPTPEAPPEPQPAPASQPPAPMDEPSGSGQTWVWVSAGVGVAGLGVGVIYGLQAADKDEQAKEHCNGTLCFDERGEELSNDAADAALIANIGYGVGAAGLLTSLVLAVIQKEDTVATSGGAQRAGGTTPLQVSPLVLQEGGGVHVSGAF